jgi:hypothetical protein
MSSEMFDVSKDRYVFIFDCLTLKLKETIVRNVGDFLPNDITQHNRRLDALA